MKNSLFFLLILNFNFCFAQNFNSNDSLRFIRTITLLSDSLVLNNKVEILENSIKLIFFTSDLKLSQNKKIDLLVLLNSLNQDLYNSICSKVITDSLVNTAFHNVNYKLILPLCNCKHRNGILQEIMSKLEINAFKIDSSYVNYENMFLLNGIANKIKTQKLESLNNVNFIDYYEYVFALNYYYRKNYPLIWKY